MVELGIRHVLPIPGGIPMKRLCILTLLLAVLLTGAAGESAAYTSAQVETLLVTDSSWDGQKLPRYPYGSPEVTVLRITVPSQVKLDTHKHPIPLVAYMLEGELTVQTEDGTSVVFTSGDPIVEVVNTWHFGQSTGEGDAVLVAFYMGVDWLPDTIKKE